MTNHSESQKIHVLHVTHNMDVGGTEQVITQLIQSSDQRQLQHTIACVDGTVGALGVALAKQGISVEPVSRKPGFDRKVIRQLRALIKRDRIDVVHCHQYTPYSYGVLACIGTRAAVVFTEHGRFYPDRYSWKRRLINPLLALFTQHIVAISEATRDALAHYEWLPKRRIRVIYNGVQCPENQAPLGSVRERLDIEKQQIVFGTLARLDSIKNQSMMIRAIAELRETRPNCILLLAGDGPQREELESEVAKLGLQQAVIFTGFVSEVADYLLAMDVFLLTSFSEGTSMTLLEAMALRRASIVTRVGGNTEVVGALAARVIESDDLPALVDVMRELATDSEARQVLGGHAEQRYAELFRPQLMIEQYTTLYQRCGPS